MTNLTVVLLGGAADGVPDTEFDTDGIMADRLRSGAELIVRNLVSRNVVFRREAVSARDPNKAVYRRAVGANVVLLAAQSLYPQTVLDELEKQHGN